MKKQTLMLIPYISSFLLGFLFFKLSLIISNDDYKSIISSISASFISIPILFLGYDSIKSISSKKLNKEIFDYAKVHIDKEFLSSLNKIHKIIYPNEERTFSNLEKMLHIQSPEIIKQQIQDKKILGFTILKQWEEEQKKIEDIIKNPLILKAIDDDGIISLIQTLKSIRAIERIVFRDDFLTEKSKNRETTYELVPPNDNNPEYPERYLLLTKLNGNKGIVTDFGDIKKYSLKDVLHSFKIAPQYQEIFSSLLFSLIKDFNYWFSTTGKEILIDTKEFRIIEKRNPENA
ncbi:MAG: hypothetical protein AB7U85_10185 [Alphaproteobacteria bacterium]